MRPVFKYSLIAVAALAATVASGVIYLNVAFPKVGPAAEIEVPEDPELVARGQYLANHVSVCIDCHSERDWSYFAAPVKAGTEGAGGERFTREMGFPGEYVAPNLTPAGVGEWSDGELIRAFTTGVDRDGEPLFPMMPYGSYAHMSQRDREAIVAYLRTLAPIETAHPDSETDFPMSLIMRTIPAEAPAPSAPPEGDELARGRYLSLIGGCYECHTPQDHGTPLEGMDYAGGFEFGMGEGRITRSANLTPHPSGLGSWTREQFISRFRDHRGEPQAIAPDAGQTPMPWRMYAGMSDEDLGALYAFLQSLPAVDHGVVKFESRP